METLNPNPNLNPSRRPAPGSARALAEKFPSLEGSGVSSVPLPGEGLGVGSPRNEFSQLLWKFHRRHVSPVVRPQSSVVRRPSSVVLGP